MRKPLLSGFFNDSDILEVLFGLHPTFHMRREGGRFCFHSQMRQDIFCGHYPALFLIKEATLNQANSGDNSFLWPFSKDKALLHIDPCLIPAQNTTLEPKFLEWVKRETIANRGC